VLIGFAQLRSNLLVYRISYNGQWRLSGK